MPFSRKPFKPFGGLDLGSLIALSEMPVAWPEFIFELHQELVQHEFPDKEAVLLNLHGRYKHVSNCIQCELKQAMDAVIGGYALPERLNHAEFSAGWSGGRYKPLIQNLSSFLILPVLGVTGLEKLDLSRMPGKKLMIEFAKEFFEKIVPFEKKLIGDQVWMFNFLKQVAALELPVPIHNEDDLKQNNSDLISSKLIDAKPVDTPKTTSSLSLDWGTTAKMIRHAKLNPKAEEVKKLLNANQWADHSPLNLLGYSVDVKIGLAEKERREFLVDFCEFMVLPLGLPVGYTQPWGDPGTRKRILKTAKHLSFLRRNFEKQDAQKYARAIACWQSDFDYLQQHFNRLGIKPIEWVDAYTG